MKDELDKLLGFIETALFDPFRFADGMEQQIIRYRFVLNITAAFSAISIAAGAVYITPPYSSGNLLQIAFMSIFYYFFFMVAPGIFAVLVERNILEKKERRSGSQILPFLAGMYLSVFILFTPLMMILGQSGTTGGVAYFLFMSALMLIYIYLFSLAATAVYEVEMKVAFSASMRAIGTMLVFPFLFNFLFISSLMGLVN